MAKAIPLVGMPIGRMGSTIFTRSGQCYVAMSRGKYSATEAQHAASNLALQMPPSSALYKHLCSRSGCGGVPTAGLMRLVGPLLRAEYGHYITVDNSLQGMLPRVPSYEPTAMQPVYKRIALEISSASFGYGGLSVWFRPVGGWDYLGTYDVSYILLDPDMARSGYGVGHTFTRWHGCMSYSIEIGGTDDQFRFYDTRARDYHYNGWVIFGALVLTHQVSAGARVHVHASCTFTLDY